MFVTGRTPLLIALGVLPMIPLDAAGVDAWIFLAVWTLGCALLVTADAASAANLTRIEVERGRPGRTRLGESVVSELWLANSGARVLRAIVRDGWQPTAGAPDARTRVDVPSGERRRVSTPLLPRRRGELRSDFVAVRALGPLGLAGRQRVVPVRGVVRVLPPFTSRRHLPSRLARLRELDGNTSIQVRGQGTEFDSLREYVRGDDVRSIDWRATARAGTTMLRTWRPERDRHIVVVVDTGRTAAARVGDGTRLDAAMEATLLLAALATRAGDHLHLVMFDRVVRARVSGVNGPALLPALVDAMAPVEASLIDTDWSRALEEARRVHRRPAMLVLLTAQDAVDAARPLLGSLDQAARGTVLLVGSATDTAADGVASDRRDAEGVYRAAAAIRTTEEADRVATAIGRAGGEAIAASADDLPPRIADRYLDLKARGRL